jgi:hypothetical protein
VDTARLTRLSRSGGLVFLNACHTARLIDDPEYNDAIQRGFAEVFLRAGATEFLGTLGVVTEDQAHRYVVELVDRLRQNPDVPVAETIRDLRRRYTVRTPPRSTGDPDSAKALLPFFYTFMYAYFGGPDDLARLPAPRGGRP